jgi:hypothetical protein
MMGERTIVCKISGVMPFTRELSDDAFDFVRALRSFARLRVAERDGRAVNRGGGWWLVDGETVRGIQRARDLLDAKADALPV